MGPDFCCFFRKIPIYSYDIDVYDSMTYEICKDKLIWFIKGYLVDAGYDSVRHWDGVLTPSSDSFAELILINRNPPCSFTLGTREMAPLVRGT